MREESRVRVLKPDQCLNWLVHWLPLIPFTTPDGIYPPGETVQSTLCIVIGDRRRAFENWQRALAAQSVNLVVVNTKGRSLTSAVADGTLTAENLAPRLAPISLTEEGAGPDPPTIYLPVLPEGKPFLTELESLTGLPCCPIPSQPKAAAETLRTGRSPDPYRSRPAEELVPLAFNLALFMSLITLGLSLVLGSEQIELWFLLPWLSCLGGVLGQLAWPRRLPGLAWGLVWGGLLGIPLALWQAAEDWATAVTWLAAAVLISVWVGWRLTSAVQR